MENKPEIPSTKSEGSGKKKKKKGKKKGGDSASAEPDQAIDKKGGTGKKQGGTRNYLANFLKKCLENCLVIHGTRNL